MVTVAISGGTGGLGRMIVDQIQKTRHKTLVISRNTSPEVEAELGVPVLAFDYDDPSAIAQKIDEYQIHTIISAMTVPGETSSNAQLNLIRGAAQSSTCKRFAPSEFGVVYDDSQDQEGLVMAKYKLLAVEELKKTNLEYTLFTVGYFMDYLGMPHIPTYLKPIHMAIDVETKSAAIPGTGNTAICFTSTKDIARGVAAMIDREKWNERSFIVGDRKTMNEVLAIAESVRGKFTVHHDTSEKLRSRQVTELPNFHSNYAFLPPAQKHLFFSVFAEWFDNGTFDLKGEGDSVNRLFPDVKMMSVRDIIEKYWTGKT